ncbi:BatD family protein [Ferrimonas balearica]|uniref:BatD family protein n=1 Tax=Ferrimonas balearica TaxID=44012 RepID=UPI001C994D62|nr:BatD family protein [Ferrimonas balearica]MBY5992958.1 BatD family protein [Ferrimonas balearica]
MVSPNAFRSLILCLLTLLISPAWALTQLQATVDQNPVTAGQSFILEVVADDDLDSNALDTSALLSQFAVGQTQVSRSTQIVNFDARRETRWTIMLLAREPGTLTIPALEVEGIRSAPIELTVLARGQEAADGQAPLIFLDTELASQSVWLGQPLLATVRLYLGADLQRGALNAPSLDNALVRQLGQDREQSQIIKGRRYRVVERDYVIVPQTTGQLTLEAASFEGDVMVPSARRDLFGRAQSRPMAIQGEPQTLTVKPKPAAYQGHWLAADLVTLSDSLEGDSQFEVGQPITRTLTLTAVGAVEESLGEVEVSLPESFRLYPDKAERSGGVQNGQLIARLQQSMAMVPAQPGTYTLPQIRVPWWNAKLNQQSWVTVPAKTVTVTGLAGAPLDAPAPTLAPPQIPPTQPVAEPGLWPWVSLALALAWLTTLVWGWRRGQAPASPSVPPSAPAPSASLKALLVACRANDAAKTLALLPRWASEHQGRAVSLAQLPTLYPALAAPLEALQRSRYSAQSAQWQGQSLHAALKALPQSSTGEGEGPLPPLDPTTRMES